MRGSCFDSECESQRGLFVVLGPLIVGFLEVADALADTSTDFRQPAGAEDQDDDEDNDDEFRYAEAHGDSLEIA